MDHKTLVAELRRREGMVDAVADGLELDRRQYGWSCGGCGHWIGQALWAYRDNPARSTRCRRCGESLTEASWGRRVDAGNLFG